MRTRDGILTGNEKIKRSVTGNEKNQENCIRECEYINGILTKNEKNQGNCIRECENIKEL